MISRRTLVTAFTAAAAGGTLAACGGDKSTTQKPSANPSAPAEKGGAVLDKLTISDNVGKEPKVTFDAPLEYKEQENTVVVKGDGAAVKQGDTIITRSVFIDPASGDTLFSEFKEKSATALPVVEKTIGKSAAEFFSGMAVGTRFAQAGFTADQSGQGQQPILQVGDLEGIALKRAEGTQKPVPSGMPEFTLGDNGAPELKGKPSGKAPTELVAEPTIVGTGEKAAKGDTLVMHYTGWDWETGEKFDSSWDRGEPFVFPLGAGRVIPGWDNGLEGAAAGSQYLLVIPPKDGYGDDPAQHELGGKTLIFAADVLYVAKA
ncbi:FKBP-type peptidyl-prolyl cis-trans isomerase [Helcobacillus sp. ACRRO]|uniref:FKBP-type peptidyl-prolyl cis-trans isomerase n=1 Tax=Helcobacillus sp. ACRRO TaxID=2918202 RepID=UPI001EF5AAAB|nr:FKBP-type peptidyl-prolyl cis-trans isomerase [Helcobacillus sp. ACRRO]